MNAEDYKQILEEIASFPQEARLLAVTKYSDIGEINEAIKQGVKAIGENRVESALEKFPLLKGSVEKHFIGAIQTKKIRRIVELFDVIESVGSMKHLEKIDLISGELKKEITVYLQFNISGEEQKSGFTKQDIPLVLESLAKIKNVKVIGIMGMASQSDESKNREEFKSARSIRDEIRKNNPDLTELSIGMSNDYIIALEEGSTLVRIGSALFK